LARRGAPAVPPAGSPDWAHLLFRRGVPRLVPVLFGLLALIAAFHVFTVEPELPPGDLNIEIAVSTKRTPRRFCLFTHFLWSL
jgi:hypothetical protein